MKAVSSLVAGPHPAKPGATLHRVGSLLWWRFVDSATPFPDLAKQAHKAGFPALFLPVPFPVSNGVAFQRALRRATSSVPDDIGGRWTHDRVPTSNVKPLLKKHGVDPATWEAWFAVDGWVSRLDLQRFPKELGIDADRWKKLLEMPPDGVEQVERFDPTSSAARPWLGKLLCAVEPVSGLLVFLVTSTSPSTDGTLEMIERIRTMYDEERTLATYPEIGDGVVAALEDVGGVKLRPGLWALPGDRGVERADTTLEYLRQIGSSKAGMMDLYRQKADDPGVEGLIQIALAEEIDSLARKLQEDRLAEMQTGALRTAWNQVAQTESRIEVNRTVLGPAADELHQQMHPLKLRVEEAARNREKTVELAKYASKADVRHLREALSALRAAAQKGSSEMLRNARPLLTRARAAARAGGFISLLDRLQKLVDAAEHVHEGPVYDALEEAVGFVEERARKASGIKHLFATA